MSTISASILNNQLAAKIGRESAEGLITYIDERIKDESNNISKMMATKENLANAKSDLVKWMFIFWIGQIGATLGIILDVLKK